ncbi:MAG TPA: hypothetical protein VHF08_02605, partial [Nitrososphaeraceae archaeon]|nr:hypothetical protein [Nitrososphaeraceae archaeon]
VLCYLKIIILIIVLDILLLSSLSPLNGSLLLRSNYSLECRPLSIETSIIFFTFVCIGFIAFYYVIMSECKKFLLRIILLLEL